MSRTAEEGPCPLSLVMTYYAVCFLAPGRLGSWVIVLVVDGSMSKQNFEILESLSNFDILKSNLT
jgi:hypothetical protein